METIDSSVTEIPTERIHTTVGDLIHAISEAAQEAMLTEAESLEVMQAVFVNLVSRRQLAPSE